MDGLAGGLSTPPPAAERSSVRGALPSNLRKSRAVLHEQVLHAAGPQPCEHCGGTDSGAAFGPITTRSGEHRRVDLDPGLLGC